MKSIIDCYTSDDLSLEVNCVLRYNLRTTKTWKDSKLVEDFVEEDETKINVSGTIQEILLYAPMPNGTILPIKLSARFFLDVAKEIERIKNLKDTVDVEEYYS